VPLVTTREGGSRFVTSADTFSDIRCNCVVLSNSLFTIMVCSGRRRWVVSSETWIQRAFHGEQQLSLGCPSCCRCAAGDGACSCFWSVTCNLAATHDSKYFSCSFFYLRRRQARNHATLVPPLPPPPPPHTHTHIHTHTHTRARAHTRRYPNLELIVFNT
jgi:hypothetical protein